MENRQWRTIKQVSELRPVFTESALRNLIHRSEENGLSPCITRKGRRVYIDLNGLDSWMEGK